MFSQTRTRSPIAVRIISECNRMSGQLTMPVGDVLVGDTRGHVKHDDATLPVDVVSISQTTKLFLSSGIPHIEIDLAKVLS
jgi:hypothetical protein